MNMGMVAANEVGALFGGLTLIILVVIGLLGLTISVVWIVTPFIIMGISSKLDDVNKNLRVICKVLEKQNAPVTEGLPPAEPVEKWDCPECGNSAPKTQYKLLDSTDPDSQRFQCMKCKGELIPFPLLTSAL